MVRILASGRGTSARLIEASRTLYNVMKKYIYNHNSHSDNYFISQSMETIHKIIYIKY